MSDASNRRAERVGGIVSSTYSALVTICATLPVPIALPTERMSSTKATAAVRRVIEIISDQPMPDEPKGALTAACIFFLATADLAVVQITYTDIDRVMEVEAVADVCRNAMYDLLTWVTENQE
jgi:hypothetical protein